MAMATEMAIYLCISLLLVTAITATTLPPSPSPSPAATTPPLPSPAPTQTPPLPSPAATPQPLPSPPAIPQPIPSPPATQTPPLPSSAATQTPPVDIQENQLKNIIDALVGAGDFGGWAHLLSSADSSALPVMATLFIPSDNAAAHANAVNDAFDPFLIPYHVIPRRLTFADLTHLAVDTRIPTLLPHKFVIITNNSASNFTVDGSQITQADIFSNTAFAVHGINNVLDYSVYGAAALNSPPPVNIDVPEVTNSSVGPRKRGNPVFPEEFIMGVKSGAPPGFPDGFWIQALMVLLNTYFWVWLFKLWVTENEPEDDDDED